jgi:hypothetical protein
LTHPGAQSLTARLVKCLSGRAYIERRRRVIFVCGGAIKPGTTNDRTAFLDWANAHVANEALCLLSEEAYKTAAFRATKFINLGEFEKTLASISDCVLIFPESAGSYGELGIFATVNGIKHKTLTANRSSHQIHDSFLLQGPLHAINVSSCFTPGVVYDVTSTTAPPFSEQIWIRIQETPYYKSRKQLSNQPFVAMPQLDQIAVISWILSVTGVAKFGDLLQILRMRYNQDKKDVRILKQTLNSMLLLKQLSVPQDELYQTAAEPDISLSVTGAVSKLSAQFKNFWIREFPDLLGY